MLQKTKPNSCVSIIFNPVSGKEDPELRKQVISETLARHGYTCQFTGTTKERGANLLASEAREARVDLVVVSGGDGTVMEVLSAMVGSSIPVAVLPAGTANLLSVNLGIPTTVPEAVEIALKGIPKKVDLAKTDQGRYFAIMSGIGMDGKSVHDADRESKNKLGVFAYIRAIWINRNRRNTWMEVRLDDKSVIRRKAKSVLIANMGKITGGLQAVPSADPTNGTLEVTIVTIKSTLQWFRALALAAFAKTDRDPEVDILRAKKVSVLCERDEWVHFDGEEGGKMNRLSVEVVPGAVTILVNNEY